MRPRTQKQPQVKKELCRALDDVDVDVDELNLIICRGDSGAAGRSVIRGSSWPSVTFHP